MVLRIEKISKYEWFLGLFDEDSDWPGHSTRIFDEKPSKFSVAGMVSLCWNGVSFETRLKLIETVANVLPERWKEGIYDLEGYITLVELLR